MLLSQPQTAMPSNQSHAERLVESLRKRADKEVNIRITETDANPLVQFNITRNDTSFYRATSVSSVTEGYKAIRHYAKLRDRFSQFVAHLIGSVEDRKHKPQMGLGPFGITGLYPRVVDGSVHILVRYRSEEGDESTMFSGRRRSPEELAQKVADVLKTSVHPDHDRSEDELVSNIAEGIRSYAYEQDAIIDGVLVPRVTYETLYEAAGCPEGFPLPSELPNA